MLHRLLQSDTLRPGRLMALMTQNSNWSKEESRSRLLKSAIMAAVSLLAKPWEDSSVYDRLMIR